MRLVGITTAVILLALSSVACSGDETEDTTTTTTFGVVTSQGTGGGNQVAATTTTTVTTTAAPDDEPSTATFPRYQIVAREPGEDGDIVVVLLDTTTYDGLTDIDLQNIVADVVEEFPPVLEAYVVDSADAAAVVRDENPSPEALALLDEHYLVRLEEGFRMVFAGPFKSRPVAILGS